MKKILPYIFICILIVSLQNKAKAQDPHFTQFFASPLTLNPAFTGLFAGGDLRLAANYRSQWSKIAQPYVTGTVSADFGILKKHISYKDRWGVGILGMYDQQAGGGLKTTYGGLSTAYHLGLNADGSQTFGVGVQLAYVQKRLDMSKLTFENQLTNNGFNQSLPNGEYFDKSSVSYPDLNIGLLYNASIGTYGNFYIGGSYYHTTQPDESFLGGRNNTLPTRVTLHSGGGWAPNPMTRIYLSGLYMNQAKAKEIAAGGAVGFVVNDDPMDANLFYIGAWYRVNDAINPYIGIEIKSLHIGLSYDINVSKLHKASQDQGGVELSIIYIPVDNRNPNVINCPKF